MCPAVFARGMLKQLYTRIYFAGDPVNQNDPVLLLVPPERRDTLMAKSNPASPAIGISISACRVNKRQFFSMYKEQGSSWTA